jgi:sec-independent protein translocase protein TatA
MFGAFGLPTIGPWELIAVLAVVLIIFGPGKLPDVAKSLGKTIKEFRSASEEAPKNEAEMKETSEQKETK